MNILAIDTATQLLEVMVRTTDRRMYGLQMRAGLRHAELLMPSVTDVLLKAGIGVPDLDLIVCARGPGSFTGLRIGMATAKGIALPGATPLVSVPTLDAMAYPLRVANAAVVPVIDARKGRVYTAVYLHGERKTDYLDVEPAELSHILSPYASVVLAGPDCSAVADTPGFRADSSDGRSRFAVYPLALSGVGEAYIQLGLSTYERRGPDAPEAGPLYIRKSDAELSLERRTEHS